VLETLLLPCEYRSSRPRCTTATFDWARFDCRAARFRFEFDMRVEPLRIDPLPDPSGGPEGSHDIALAATEIDGVPLDVVEWTPPAPPPVDPGSRRLIRAGCRRRRRVIWHWSCHLLLDRAAFIVRQANGRALTPGRSGPDGLTASSMQQEPEQQ
jgi:hypothetical protein